jgi:hypothetical protein
MKRLLLICGLLWSALASAQFTPGQLLTAQELNSQFALYAPLAGATYTGSVTVPTLTVTGTFTLPSSTVLPSGVTATTNGRLDNSLQVATDAFVNQQGASAVATVPFANVTGGIYNQATLGSGCQVVVFASGGVITSSLTISNPGSGYAVGDLLAVPAGNSDAVLRVTGVSGGGVTSVGIAYGGTGYTTGNVVTTMGVPPGRRAVVLTGTLTSNLTFIIQSGTYLTASREVEFINNTTGGFTITVKLSNGAGGSTGTGVVLPQGTNNSTALTVYTDGVNDVWLSNTFSGTGAAPINSPTFTGVPAAPTAALSTNTTQIATTAFVLANAVTSNSPTITTPNIIGVSNGGNASAGSVGEYVTNTTSGTSLTSGTSVNATSVSLTAGDWDVEGSVQFLPSGTTSTQSIFSSISTTSATLGNIGTVAGFQGTTVFSGESATHLPSPIVRISISTTTTVYLVAQLTWTAGTATCNGFIRARRIR